MVSYFTVRAPSAPSDQFELVSRIATRCALLPRESRWPAPSLRPASTTVNTKYRIVTGSHKRVSVSRCRSKATFTDVSKSIDEVK